MGTAAVTITNQFPIGAFRTVVGTFTMSNSYATAGDALPASIFGLTSVSLLLFDYHRAGLLFSYTYSTGKVQAFYPTGGAAAAPTSVTAVPIGTAAAGAVAVTSSAATAPVGLTAGVGLEVGSTTDLSTMVLRFVAFGT